MPLTVGALARRTTLTVRTLHHYDEIGLLKPSARTDAGYRLYSDADVARLHAIQALRQLGLPLAEIGPILDDGQARPGDILARQIQALDRQIRQAGELRDRIALLRDGLIQGETPALDDWVRSLALMASYGRHFSAAEIRAILSAWKTIESDWMTLLGDVDACMASGTPVASERAQALARRWMALMYQWMDGDFALMDRWGAMFRQEPGLHDARGAPPKAMVDYMERAIALRVGWLREHFGDEAFRRVRLLPDSAWSPIERAGRKLIEAGRPPTGKAARELRARWEALLLQAADGDVALAARMRTLGEAQPLVLAGLPLSGEVRAFLREVPWPGPLDPHVT